MQINIISKVNDSIKLNWIEIATVYERKKTSKHNLIYEFQWWCVKDCRLFLNLSFLLLRVVVATQWIKLFCQISVYRINSSANHLFDHMTKSMGICDRVSIQFRSNWMMRAIYTDFLHTLSLMYVIINNDDCVFFTYTPTSSRNKHRLSKLVNYLWMWFVRLLHDP